MSVGVYYYIYLNEKNQTKYSTKTFIYTLKLNIKTYTYFSKSKIIVVNGIKPHKDWLPEPLLSIG